jgi:hypothetical protein
MAADHVPQPQHKRGQLHGEARDRSHPLRGEHPKVDVTCPSPHYFARVPCSAPSTSLRNC